jgi:hypothetical protein
MGTPWRCKYPDELVLATREAWEEEGLSAAVLGATFGIRKKTVQAWLRGDTRRRAGGPTRRDSRAVPTTAAMRSAPGEGTAVEPQT